MLQKQCSTYTQIVFECFHLKKICKFVEICPKKPWKLHFELLTNFLNLIDLFLLKQTSIDTYLNIEAVFNQLIETFIDIYCLELKIFIKILLFQHFACFSGSGS